MKMLFIQRFADVSKKNHHTERKYVNPNHIITIYTIGKSRLGGVDYEFYNLTLTDGSIIENVYKFSMENMGIIK